MSAFALQFLCAVSPFPLYRCNTVMSMGRVLMNDAYHLPGRHPENDAPHSPTLSNLQT